MGNSIKTIPFFGRVWLTSRLSRICSIAISLLFVSTLGARAQGDAMGRRAVLYAASGTFGVQGILYTLDPATGAVLTTVGPLNDAAGNNYGITGLKYHPATGTLWSFVANCAKIAVVARGLDGTVNAQETGERVVRAARVPPNLEK